MIVVVVVFCVWRVGARVGMLTEGITDHERVGLLPRATGKRIGLETRNFESEEFDVEASQASGREKPHGTSN